MSVMGLDIEWAIGGAKSEAVLERMSAAFERAGAESVRVGRHIWPKLVPVFEDFEQQQFDAEGRGPVIGKWQELSEMYRAWKDQHYPGKPILQREGNLVAALTVSGSPYAYRQTTDDRFDFGTKGLEYASYHQRGTETGLPVRPPFDFPPDMQRAVQAAAMEGVREALDEAGVREFATLTEEEAMATGLEIETGPRGGRYVTQGGKKSYIKRPK